MMDLYLKFRIIGWIIRLGIMAMLLAVMKAAKPSAAVLIEFHSSVNSFVFFYYTPKIPRCQKQSSALAIQRKKC